MDIISKTINVINPGQTPVDVCDQPVYALTKQIPWIFPARFGNTSYFSLFGGLRVSLTAVHGEFIEGSGLPELLGQSNLSITEIENTNVGVNRIKRARYGLQLSDCNLPQTERSLSFV